MLIVYVGPSPAVIIAESGQEATRGEPLEVGDVLAGRLLEQDVWSVPAVSKPGKPPTEED